MATVREDDGGRGIRDRHLDAEARRWHVTARHDCGCPECRAWLTARLYSQKRGKKQPEGNTEGTHRWRLGGGVTEAELLSGYASTAVLALVCALTISRVLGVWGAA